MQFELSLTNDPRSLPSVRAFTQATLRQLPLEPGLADELEAVVFDAVRLAVEEAYPPGDEGPVLLRIEEKAGRLEIGVRDHGLPVDIERLERQLHGDAAAPMFGEHRPGVVDEAHWRSFGPQGKALELVKWLAGRHVAEQSEAAELEPFHDEAPLAPQQTYTVRRLEPADAVAVSRLMYRAYGGTYFNADVYYPERIVAQNASGALRSLVVEAQDGSIVGHWALEFNQEGPVAESGQAVVDPAHRGRGLLARMRQSLEEETRHVELAGWYGDAVAVHTLTQKSDADHGGHVAGVNLGISPKTERFRKIADVQPQRVTCVLYFHWLRQPAPRTVYVPQRHRAIVAEIYANLQCPVEFAAGAQPAGHGAISVKFDAGGAKAFVRVEQAGDDTLRAIRHAKRRLVERQHAEVVFVELPLSDPASAPLAESLEADGLGFAGVAPHFSRRGDLLRLVYLVEPLAREPIKTYEPLAARLVDYALAEQARLEAL